MSLTRIQLERFTAFNSLAVELSSGINIFIGENGTGKTHILQAAYAACDVSKTRGSFAAKLVRVFRPLEDRVGRLVHRTGKSSTCSVEVSRGDVKLRSSFTNHTKDAAEARGSGKLKWVATPVESVYIPVKEVLSNAPGFRSLYATRDIAFSEVYPDLIDRALRPILRGPHSPERKRLLASIQGAMEGKVSVEEENFFLNSNLGKLEFPLVSEGMRKLALIWLLVQNGTLLDGAVLCWDEPEANLNPRKVGALVEILLELQRMGVQVLLATHDYVLIKELSLRAKAGDSVRFHALYRDAGGKVLHKAAETFAGVEENAITATFADLYNRDVRRSLGVP
jgi:ABC-type transport system involved in cytochrome c biogenesis ATPase subunit